MFSFERLKVYPSALEFLSTARELSEQLPRGNSGLKEHFQRASISIVLNIAEGSGSASPAENARYVGIARASAVESAAIIDICRSLELLEFEALTRAREELLLLVEMLSRHRQELRALV